MSQEINFLADAGINKRFCQPITWREYNLNTSMMTRRVLKNTVKLLNLSVLSSFRPLSSILITQEGL